MVQLLRDLRERLLPGSRRGQLEVAAAGVVGDRREARIRPTDVIEPPSESSDPPRPAVPEHGRLQPYRVTITSSCCARRITSMMLRLFNLKLSASRRRR